MHRARSEVPDRAHVRLQGPPGRGRAARAPHLPGHMRITQLCCWSCAEEPGQKARGLKSKLC